MSPNDRKKLLEKEDKTMSFRKQCELLDISRSGLFYESKGESKYNIELMNMIDKEYTDHPNMGVLRYSLIFGPVVKMENGV